MRSQSSKPVSQIMDVDLNKPSCNSDSSGSAYANDDTMSILLSSSSRPPDIEVQFGNEPDPFEKCAYTTMPVYHLPYLVLVWQAMVRATLAVFVILTDNDTHDDTQSLMFMVGVMLSLLNMLLLSVLKTRKNNHLACVLSVFSSIESVLLVLFSSYALIVTIVLASAWVSIFVLSVNPALVVYRCVQRSTCCCKPPQIEDVAEQFVAIRNQQRQHWCIRQNYLYLRLIWYVFLSVCAEAGHLVYFWFLMHMFEAEPNLRKQRILLCCMNLKLLMTTYTRHMLFERRFSYVAMCSEFILFATTSTVVYCYTFLTLTLEQYLILHYTFWAALGLEILVNCAMFVVFSMHAI